MDGYIHSVESFGTVDGPGVRFVVFCQGCPMRCKYCHNPDTWKMESGRRIAPEELIRQYERNRAFYSRGGITVTGGEPLLQIDFLTELFRLAKEKGIHTCIDTSGVTYRGGDAAYREKLDALMALTDLVMLDIKHIDSDAHKDLTGHPNERILAFAQYLEEKGIPVWIRHVAVPGVTDDAESLERLGRYIGGLSNLKALDVLPYHTMGETKYREMGIPYPLENVPAMTAEGAKAARKLILSGIRKARAEAKQSQ